jgi:hypothetical protein
MVGGVNDDVNGEINGALNGALKSLCASELDIQDWPASVPMLTVQAPPTSYSTSSPPAGTMLS